MKWKVNDADKSSIKKYSSKLGVSEMMAAVLINREMGLDNAYSLLNNPYELLLNPYDLTNAYEAVEEILRHIKMGSEIHIFADYDVDGITSGYSMTRGLQYICENDIYPYYPERSEGFGINMNYVNSAIERSKSIDNDMLIITVDNGTARVDEVNRLIDNGISVIVTDHHEPGDRLPKAMIVNPYANNDKDFYNLSGCGVVFQILYILSNELNVPYIEDFLHASALGTVADVMPLDMNNMALCSLGIDQINQRQIPKGLGMFIDNLKIRSINSQDIGWEIGPRLNACGRMYNINLAANLMFLDDQSSDVEIKDTVLDIEATNQDRKKLMKKLEKKIEDKDFSNNSVCIHYDEDISSGVAGILASRISNMHNKPSIVLSKSKEGTLSGSVRSISGINILEALLEEKELGHIIDVGGHAEAAGLSLKHDMLDKLQESMDKRLEAAIEEVAKEVPEISIDSSISLSDINNSSYDEINQFPYDRHSFSYPVFSVEGLEIIGIRESSNNPNNIRLSLIDDNGNTKDIWAWRMNDKLKALGNPKKIDIVGSIKRDFMSPRNSTFDVLDIRKA